MRHCHPPKEHIVVVYKDFIAASNGKAHVWVAILPTLMTALNDKPCHTLTILCIVELSVVTPLNS